MPAKIIDGKEIAKIIRQEVKTQVEAYAARNITVTLAVVQVGDDPASSVYIRNKSKVCAELGIRMMHIHKEADISQKQLLELIEKLNQDTEVDAVLVQLPLPAHISEKAVLESILPCKDVDGFHPINAGALASRSCRIRT